MKAGQTRGGPASGDWDDLRLVLALHDQRSTKAGAKLLGISQSTASRQLYLLEHRLGVQLFDRLPHGLSVTREGATLVARASAMRDQADAAWFELNQGTNRSSGPFRIRATEGVAVMLLPLALAQFSLKEKGVSVEVEVCNADSDTLQPPFDLAVHMHRPSRTSLITKRVAVWPLQFFAHQSLLDRYGPIRSFADAKSVPWLGFDRHDGLTKLFDRVGVGESRPEWFSLRTDSHVLRWHALKDGLGIGAFPEWLGQSSADIRTLRLSEKLPSIQVWLSSRPGMTRRPQLKSLHDALVQVLKQPLATIAGNASTKRP